MKKLLILLLFSLSALGGTNTLVDRETGQTITLDFFNDFNTALNGNFVPRSGGVPTNAQNLGTSTYRWALYATTGNFDDILTVTGTQTNITGFLKVNPGAGAAGYVRLEGFSSSFYNFIVSAGYQANDVFEITPSTAAGGSSFSNPVFKAVSSTGAVTVGNSTLGGAVTIPVALNVTGSVNLTAATASQVLAVDGSKNLTSVPYSSGGTASALLQLNSGSGSTAAYHQTDNSNNATTGFIRLPHSNTIAFRNSANSGNLTITNTSDTLTLAGGWATTAAGAATATMTNAPAGAAGNPDVWENYSYNGVTYVRPLWTP